MDSDDTADPRRATEQGDDVCLFPPMNTNLPRGMPVELLDGVAAHIFECFSPSSITAFGTTCRLFYGIACRHVYRKVVIRFSERGPQEDRAAQRIHFLLTTRRLHQFIHSISVDVEANYPKKIQDALKLLAQLMFHCPGLQTFDIHTAHYVVLHLPTALVAALGAAPALRRVVLSGVTMSARWPSNFSVQGPWDWLELVGRVDKLGRLLKYRSPRHLRVDENACGAIGAHSQIQAKPFRNVQSLIFSFATDGRSRGEMDRCNDILKTLSVSPRLNSLQLDSNSLDDIRRFSEVCCPSVSLVCLSYQGEHGWIPWLETLGRVCPNLMTLYLRCVTEMLPHDCMTSATRYFPRIALLDLNTCLPDGFEGDDWDDERAIEAQMPRIFAARPCLWLVRYRHDEDVVATFCLEALAGPIGPQLRDVQAQFPSAPAIRFIKSPPFEALRQRLAINA